MISLIFIFLAGFFNSIMDIIATRFSNSIFKKFLSNSWVNPVLAWRNKWKDGDPKKGERFFGSSTFLVWTTDLWHCSKALMITCIALSIVCYRPLINAKIDWIFYLCLFGCSFECFWRLFKR